MEWVWQNEDNVPQLPTDLNTLIIVEGSGFAILDVLNSILLKSRTPTCHLKVGQASIYQLDEHKLAVCLVEEKDLSYFSPIAASLEPWINIARNVFAVTFHSTANFKGEEVTESVDGCFVRGINNTTIKHIKELEIPNIVTGVSAGVMNFCKFHDKAASCFVIYMEAPIFDSFSTKPLIKLLKDLKVPCDDTYTYKYRSNSNLYL